MDTPGLTQVTANTADAGQALSCWFQGLHLTLLELPHLHQAWQVSAFFTVRRAHTGPLTPWGVGARPHQGSALATVAGKRRPTAVIPVSSIRLQGQRDRASASARACPAMAC